MPIRVSVDPEQRLVTTVISGAIEPAELARAYEQLLADPDFEPGMNALWDMREATLADLSYEQVRETAQFILSRSAERGRGYKSALVASTDLEFGLARMYEVFTEALPADVAVFRDIDEALRWLAE